MSNLPIAEYALLSDCHSAALVHRDGSVDWLCFPRFDSPSVFGRLLDASAGHWSIRPTGAAEVTRRYLPETMVLETTFRTATGTAVLVDALAVGRERARSRARCRRALCAAAACQRHERHRRVRGRVRTAPRVRLDLSGPRARRRGRRRSRRRRRARAVFGGPVRERRVRRAGDVHRRGAARVSASRSSTGRPRRRSRGCGHRRRSKRGSTTRPARGRPGRRCTRPTTARGTTSCTRADASSTPCTTTPPARSAPRPPLRLPESAGGTRNWDYRYAWVRDASFTLQALWVAACPDEADQFFDYLADAAATQVRRGGRPPDHVRHRRRTRPHRTRAPAPHGVARQRTRTRRQRRMEPTADRRLRRAARRGAPPPRPTRPPRPDDAALPRRPG